ncbi:helix-turn-helix transcriptional regulator [Enorma phocaeensis]|uniref:helix-turn-helix transcriptional regulator n=1 Tax=Enorma phocaeensis TaxID=1871019 RepID=UPI001958650C|nr:helix-turn-helix transcriptional regulator [Enorma phocaeensis]
MAATKACGEEAAMGAEGAQTSLAIGERIKQSRAAAGLSQEALARLVGVSRQTVSNWERSRTTPDAYALKRIAEACGTTVDSLLGGDAAVVHDRALATRRELVCAAAILLSTQLVSIAINAATAVFAGGAASEDFTRPFAAFRLGVFAIGTVWLLIIARKAGLASIRQMIAFASLASAHPGSRADRALRFICRWFWTLWLGAACGISAAGLLLGAAASSNVQLLLGAAVMLGPAAIAFSWEHGKNSSSSPRAKEA